MFFILKHLPSISSLMRWYYKQTVCGGGGMVLDSRECLLNVTYGRDEFSHGVLEKYEPCFHFKVFNLVSGSGAESGAFLL